MPLAIYEKLSKCIEECHIIFYIICDEMKERKSQIFALSFHHKLCKTGFILHSEKVGTTHSMLLSFGLFCLSLHARSTGNQRWLLARLLRGWLLTCSPRDTHWQIRFHRIQRVEIHLLLLIDNAVGAKLPPFARREVCRHFGLRSR